MKFINRDNYIGEMPVKVAVGFGWDRNETDGAVLIGRIVLIISDGKN